MERARGAGLEGDRRRSRGTRTGRRRAANKFDLACDEDDDPLFDSPPDVGELRTNSTWHADKDDDPLFDSRREYLEQIDPGGSRARFLGGNFEKPQARTNG